MVKPTAPLDPNATVTDGDSMSQLPDLSAGPTGTTPQVNTDATFVELPTVAGSSADLLPRSDALSVLEETDKALRAKLDAAEMSARSTVTGADDPEPVSTWTPLRIAAVVGMGSMAFILLAILVTPSVRHINPALPRHVARAEPPPPEKPLEPKAMPAALAPIYLEVEVDAGEGEVRMEKREAGVIKINSSPDTEVTVNGKKLGPTPVYVSAPIGRVDLILESRDAGIYKPIVLNMLPGQNSPRSWDLARGWLEVIAMPGSVISVDGRVVGTAPIEQVSLYEGFHRLDVVRPDKSRVTSRLEVVPRFTVTHEVPDL